INAACENVPPSGRRPSRSDSSGALLGYAPALRRTRTGQPRDQEVSRNKEHAVGFQTAMERAARGVTLTSRVRRLPAPVTSSCLDRIWLFSPPRRGRRRPKPCRSLPLVSPCKSVKSLGHLSVSRAPTQYDGRMLTRQAQA